MSAQKQLGSPAASSAKRPGHRSSFDVDQKDEEQPDTPYKKQKLSSPSAQASDIQLSKKGRACIACRKLKVKCDSADRGDAGCSRCQRLGLECVNAKKLRLNLDGENDQDHAGLPQLLYHILTAVRHHPSIVRLDRAVQAILQKLKMPSLEMYETSAVVEPNNISRLPSGFQTTRENSRDPVEGELDIAPAPMGSLYEVTQLNSLRSQLRKANPAKRSSHRRIETDLVSQKLISLEDAEQLLELFKKSLARYLYAATMSEDTTLQSVRESSTLLFTAVMLVSALHIPGKESIHSICHNHFLELVAKSMFERYHTLDDIRALCIAAFWQPDLSWKLSGLCVRMATELNLHQAFYTAFYTQNITEEQRKRALEKARVWYLLYVLDHHFSIAYGRPPVTVELLPIKEYEVFVNSPWCTLSDRRLISQVSLFVILSKAYEVFGLEPERLMGGDDASLLMHLRFTEDINAWYDRWRNFVLPDKYIADYPSKGVHVHYHFSSLVLNSLALRGRPLDSTLSTALPHSLRPLALRAIESAHAILQFFLDEPSYRDSLVGVPLYLHSMIAFAVVFLMKMSHRWYTIGVTIDPETRTKPLIEGTIEALKKCKAGSGHMVFSMAEGFQRMLRNSWGKDSRQLTNGRSGRSKQDPQATKGQHGNGNSYQSSNIHTAPLPGNEIKARLSSSMTSPDIYLHPHGLSQSQLLPFSSGSQVFTSPSNQDATSYFDDYTISSNAGGGMGGYGGYSLGLGSQDDMLWSAGMGYDL